LSINHRFGEITVVWVEIDTWVIEKMAYKRGEGGGIG
jgi:hypothetical protein